MKKHLKKFIVIGVITGVLLLMTLFDYLRAQTVNIEVVSVTPETVVADPNKPVTITLRVTKRGQPAAGDDISALVTGPGNLSGDKVRVQEDGTVSFTYYPYTYLEGVFEEDTTEIKFRDISDSIFIAIQKRETVTLEVKKPTEQSGGMNMNDIFGED